MNHNICAKVISLSDDVERRQYFLERNTPASVNWTFFPASSTLDCRHPYSPKSALVHKGRELTNEELGCFSSHIRLWYDFLDSTFEHIIVLEDDVIVDWHGISLLVEHKALLDLPGVIRLFTRSPAKHTIIGEFKDRFITRITGYASGSQAYILSKSVAQQLIDNIKIISCPIDDYIDRYWRHGVVSYSIYPFPVIERMSKTRIPERILDSDNRVNLAMKIFTFGEFINRIIFDTINYNNNPVKLKLWDASS